MSGGIDSQMIRDYYQRMSDTEIVAVLSHNLSGLTEEAQAIVKDEIKRRKLGGDILKIVEAQQVTDNYQSKNYDADSAPVDENVRQWLDKSFLTLLNIFGNIPTINRKVLVPERKDFNVKYDGSEGSAVETMKIVARQMQVDPEKIALDFYDEGLREITNNTPAGLYWGKGETGHFEISVARKKLDEPEEMVATLAHEIAHIKLLGENRMEENDEDLTDLTTIFFGLGVFNANAAFKTFADAKYYGWSQQGYLSQMEWGYALALFAYIRKEEKPYWAEYLSMNVKADFIQAQNFIAENPDKILLH